METDLLIFSKLNDYDKIADLFRQGIEMMHNDVNNLTVEYDGERLSITCDGDIFYQNKIYETANILVRKFSEKHETKFDIERILKNTFDIMNRAHPGWRKIVKNNPPPKFTK